MSDETRQGVPVEEQDERTPFIAVKTIGGSGGAISNVRVPGDAAGSVFSGTGGVTPPYDAESLGQIFEDSALLRPNVDAYVQNVDGSGHQFEAEIDPDADDADDKIRAAIRVEKMRSVHWRIAAAGAELELFEPTDAELFERKERLRRLMAFEKARLEAFFEYCCRQESFPSLRMKTRQDLEVTGNGAWEVLRDVMGDIVEFVGIPFYTLRLLPLDKEFTEYKISVKITPVSYEERKAQKRFRKFVQVIDGQTTVFKELGDPRFVSRKNGRVFQNKAEWEAHVQRHPDDGLATELLHFKIYSSSSPYGVPRWVGALTEVLGARAASEVNHSYFDNKAVPPLAILVSGGRLRRENVKELEDHIKNEIKGRQNFHKPLLLEAVSADKPGSPNPSDAAKIKIQLVPLMNAAQMKDALFMGYTTQSKQLVREQFRNPPIMVGDSKDYNRATSDNAMLVGENQVYATPRQGFDDIINRTILPDLGITTYRFKSKSIVSKNAEQLSKQVEGWTREGILTPEEARLFAQEVFGVTLKRIDDVWVTQPWPLTRSQAAPAPGAGQGIEQDAEGDPQGIAGLPQPGRDGGGRPPRGLNGESARLMQGLAGEARRVLALRDALIEARKASAAAEYVSAKPEGAPAAHLNGAADLPEVDRILVPDEALLSWVEPDPC